MFYCNSTLFGLSLSSLNQLQKIQNNAARLVPCEQKSDHVIPLLEKLHWLPVDACIHYKVATLDFRHFRNSLLLYLSKLLHTYQPSQTLWSSREKLLKVPQTNFKSSGTDLFTFKQLKSGTLFLQLSATLLFQKQIWNIFLKNASLLVCKAPFLHSLTTDWMCVCTGGGVDMITDVLYGVNNYVQTIFVWSALKYGVNNYVHTIFV